MADEVIAGRYRLVEPLGHGSMSAVWAADDLELGRRVAVKTLGPRADRQRFEREARAAASLSHPNIVSLYDYGESGGRPFMVLECLPGGSLEDRLREGAPLPDAEAEHVATQIAAGLAHAHARGLVHRDLKPANILFDAEGRPKIADFGIARMGGSGTLTEAGTVLGTATYLSPEQAAGLPAGPQSDVYSLGVILFRMLTGRLPFVSANAMELVRMHRDEAPPAIGDVRPDAPAALAAVATAALAKDPAARPVDGADVLARLRGADATLATQVLPPPPVPPARRRRRALPAILAATVLLLAGGALALALTHGGGGDTRTDTSLPASLTLPAVPTAASIPTTSEATTTRPATSTTGARTTTAAPTTTEARPTTTARATTVLPPTTTVAPPTTVVPPTTSAAPTTTSTPVTTAGTTTVGVPPTTTAGP